MATLQEPVTALDVVWGNERRRQVLQKLQVNLRRFPCLIAFSFATRWQLDTQGTLNKLRNKKRLRRLQVRGSTTSDDVCALLQNVPGLSQLTISHKNRDVPSGPWSAALATGLRRVPGLLRLCVEFRGFDATDVRNLARGLRFVPRLEQLQLLGLGWNEAGDNGARAVATALQFVPNLQLLCLTDVGIWEPGARAVATALRFVPKLRELNLCNNMLLDSGAKVFATFGLKHVPQLRILNLTGCDIGAAGRRALNVASRHIPHCLRVYACYRSRLC